MQRVVVDLGAIEHPDLGHVDALVRLQLAAKRVGFTLWMVNAGVELVALMEFVGLPLEAGGEAKRLEELGVEEVVEPGDPPA